MRKLLTEVEIDRELQTLPGWSDMGRRSDGALSEARSEVPWPS